MVQVELDRVLVQSNVSQPRFAVGMLASDELARLDLAAEKLLDGVAGGEVPLPLAPKVASQAASLATELRLHLIEGRRETWLHHAVTESEYLGRSVTLADPSSLAGLLAPPQRDGLLQAVWLLLGDSKSRSPGTAITLGLGPVTAAGQSLAGAHQHDRHPPQPGHARHLERPGARGRVHRLDARAERPGEGLVPRRQPRRDVIRLAARRSRPPAFTASSMIGTLEERRTP
jgi:hypothetical protein